MAKKKQGGKKLPIKIAVAAVAGMAVSGLTVGMFADNKIDSQQEQIKSLSEINKALKSDVGNLSFSVDNLNKQLSKQGLVVEEMDEELAVKESVISDLKEELEVVSNQVSSEASFNGYEEDGLSLDHDGLVSVDNGDLEKLGDYEIEFDGDDIDVLETISVSGEFDANDKDFDGELMYKLPEGSVEYKVSFDTDMSALDYNEDSAVFDFLGSELEVTEWGSDYVVVKDDLKKSVVQGDVVNGVEITKIGESAILVSYDGESFVVDNGDTVDLGDVEVEVIAIFEDGDDSIAVVKIGEDLESTIEDGDEFEADDNYEWRVTTNSIGLVLAEDFDEDDSALVEGGLFSLPGNYASFSFEVDSVDYSDLDVEFESASEVTFEGDFDNIDGDVVFNGSEFIDDEEGDALGLSVELDDSDYSLSFNGTHFLVGDVAFDKGVSSVVVNGNDYSGYDVDVLSTEGLVVVAPEDDLDDNRLSLIVPEEAVEVSLLFE